MKIGLAVVATLTALFTGSILWSTTECPTAELRFGKHPNIMCLELAFTAERADATVALWSANGGEILRTAHADNVADYAFMTFYGGVLAFAGWKASKALAPANRFHRGVLVRAPIFAALCDAFENIGIFRILASAAATSGSVALVTSLFASVKFALLILWIGAAFVLLVRNRNPR